MNLTFYKDRVEMFRQTVPPDSIGAEIGVQRGEFSKQILDGVNPRALHLVDAWKQQTDYGLDPANVSEEQHLANYRYVYDMFQNDRRVAIHRVDSIGAATILDSKGRFLDWFYLDANHSYQHVLNDLLVWSKLLLPDGCIYGHDYCINGKTIKFGFGVVEAVMQFCTDYRWKITALTEEEWSSFQLTRV